MNDECPSNNRLATSRTRSNALQPRRRIAPTRMPCAMLGRCWCVRQEFWHSRAAVLRASYGGRIRDENCDEHAREPQSTVEQIVLYGSACVADNLRCRSTSLVNSPTNNRGRAEQSTFCAQSRRLLRRAGYMMVFLFLGQGESSVAGATTSCDPGSGIASLAGGPCGHITKRAAGLTLFFSASAFSAASLAAPVRKEPIV